MSNYKLGWRLDPLKKEKKQRINSKEGSPGNTRVKSYLKVPSNLKTKNLSILFYIKMK